MTVALCGLDHGAFIELTFSIDCFFFFSKNHCKLSFLFPRLPMSMPFSGETRSIHEKPTMNGSPKEVG